MYNTYTNSVLWSIRSRGCQDYSYLLPERSERYQIAVSSSSPRCCSASSRSCCCCCSTSSPSFVKPKASINPTFLLYGLRQSTLIQWPSFRRRLLVGGGDRLFDRFHGCKVDEHCCDEHCCEVSCYSRERYCVGARRNRGFRLRVSEESHECCDRDGLADVEAMITLLSEELGEECSCRRERNQSSVRRVELKKKVKYGGDCRVGNVRRVDIEERTNCGNGRSTQKDKREELERRQRLGREEYRVNGRSEEVKVRENYDCEHCGNRKKSSQLDSDSWRAYKSDAVESRGETSRKNEEREAQPRRTKSSSFSSYYTLSSSGEFESDTEDQDMGVGYDRENQTKSEKKLVEVSVKGSQSRKEDSQVHSRWKVDETANGVSSSYQKQGNEREDNSNQVMNLNRRRRKQYSQTGGRVSQSRRNFEEDTEIHEIHVNDVEMNSQSGKFLSGREENSVLSVRSDAERENIERSTRQLNERLEIRYVGQERAQEMLRQSKYSSRQEEDSNVRRNSVQEINEQQHQADERMSKQMGVSLSETSEIYNTDVRNTSVSHVENRVRNQEAHTSLVSGLRSEEEKQHYHMGEMQSTKNSVSVSHTSDIIRVTESHRTSEKSIIGQESTTIVQLDGEAKERHARKDSRLEKDQTAFGLQGSQEKIFGEAPSSQSSLSLVSQNIIQQVKVDSEEIRGSQTVLIPPPSQLVNRGSSRGYQPSGALTQDFTYGTSESGYSAAHENPEAGALINSGSAGELTRITAHEDALGSALRLEQSSEQFIGEFVEKAKHNASTSETREERTEKLRRRDSRQSSGGLGAKGPSDEMWVTDSAQGTPQPGAKEGIAAAGSGIVKRSGRSLWSIIGDIARLRWSPRAGSPDSVAKPARKSSPDESVSSATWFSGHEHDGSSDDNAKGEKTVLPQEAASPHQLEVGQVAARSQFESSGSMKLRPQSGQHEMAVSSPSSGRLVGGSASMSGDQSLGVDEEIKSFESHIPVTNAAEMPLSPRMSTGIKEPSESSRTGASGGQSAGREEGRSFQTRVPAPGGVPKPSPSSRRLEGGSASNRLSSMSSDQSIGVDEEKRSFGSRLPETDAGEMPLLLPARSLRRSPGIKELSESNPTGASGGQSAGREEGRSFQTRVPAMGAVQKPSLLPGQSLRSPVIQEPPESRPTVISGSSSLREQEEQQPLSARSHEGTDSTMTDSVLKQRKLLRKKQVVRDRFDEWEEAYILEAERRKVDEMFMREALIEAKKAADMWEVPVGAVLVHDGKIIARGCNLVEELRDSTAHAEMICIREASKVLRSWRLADTTLYVTLEPCPMCAGAILQARVKTLVWGAPNRLLGADGSWIRLFPGGEGNGSEPSDKPPAPVHPFHPKMIIRRGVLESECADTMQQFFQLRRKKKDKAPDNNPDLSASHDHHHHHPSRLLNKMHQILPFFCL